MSTFIMPALVNYGLPLVFLVAMVALGSAVLS
jgi:hypothetical protein